MDSIRDIDQEILTTSINILKSQAKVFTSNSDYIKEYHSLDRNIRDTQIGRSQKDKRILNQDDTLREIVKAVRIPIPYQHKIVDSEVAFEFGDSISLIPSEENSLTEEIQDTWKNQRLFDKYTEAKTLQKSVCESAILFDIVKKEKKKFKINNSKSANDKLKFNTKVLSYENCEMYPYFDVYGGLKFFSYSIDVFKGKKKENHFFIYDEKEKMTIVTRDDKDQESTIESHGFDCIPVLYLCQKKPSYFHVQHLIDRYELSISRLGGSNDYSGHPILFTSGDVTGMPDRNADGKHINAEINIDDDGRSTTGDAKFLTHDNAPASVKMEQEGLLNMINFMTSTPNLSFDNLKGLGAVSGEALKFMFTDSFLKANRQKGKNTTDIERLLNIILSGILTTINKSSVSLANDLSYDIEFGSILPNSTNELVDNTTKAVDKGIMSKQTAIQQLKVVDNVEEELINIAGTEE